MKTAYGLILCALLTGCSSIPSSTTNGGSQPSTQIMASEKPADSHREKVQSSDAGSVFMRPLPADRYNL